MSTNLEKRINQPNQYKSAGERKIAEILTKYDIPFKYESPVLVHDSDNKLRIWYPDFFLPESCVFIEYYGLAGNQDYDTGITRKNAVYGANGVSVISILGSATTGHLEKLLITEVYGTLEGRLRSFGARVNNNVPPGPAVTNTSYTN